jgi:hypothetical protein
MLTHWRNLPTWARIRRSVTPADTALIEFVPKTAEFVPSLSDEDRSKKGAGMVGVEDTVTSRSRSPLKFFVLVFALSIPFWVLGAVTGRQLSPDLPVSSLIWV